MNAKNNRVNHDFQIVHFLAGSCHTADGAYSLLCDLKEDRETALKNVKAGQLRTKAKKLIAERLTSSQDEVAKLQGQADLAEIEAYAELEIKNISAAQDELAFIEKCIERVQPLRKFAHLTDPEAHEAAQRDEWKFEFLNRAQNYMLTGGIPADELAHMRRHPDFHEVIAPVLTQLFEAVKIGKIDNQFFLDHSKKEFDLPFLLEQKAI